MQMEAFRAATEEEAEEMPNWIYSFWRHMIDVVGRKEDTAKQYAATFRKLFEESWKAPSEMAKEEYVVMTKASPKNKTGNGQRGAAVAAFKLFFEYIQGDKSRLEAAPPDLKMCKVQREDGEPRRAAPKNGPEHESEEARTLRQKLQLPNYDWKCVVRRRASGDLVTCTSPGGTTYTQLQEIMNRLGRATPSSSSSAPVPAPKAKEAPAPKAKEAPAPKAKEAPAPKAKEAPAPKAKAAAKVPKAKEAKVVEAKPEPESDEPKPPERRVVDLTTAFKLAAAAVGSAGTSTQRPRALHIHGMDPSANLANRIHGLYIEKEQQNDDRPIFEKTDQEKITTLSWNGDKKLWRISAGLDSNGDFAKVKDAVPLPWQVSKPWKVFNKVSTKHEEDKSLKLKFLDPSQSLPAAEVEVCLPPLPAPPQTVSQVCLPPLPAPSQTVSQETASAGPSATCGALLISGLDDSAKNAERIKGFYLQQEEDHDGRPVFAKAGKGKTAFVFYSKEKEKWRIAKSLEDKRDFAHVKDKAQLPWDIKKSWKVYDGEKHKEDGSFQLSHVDPAEVPADSASMPAVQEPKAAETSEPKRRKTLEEHKPLEELPPEVASALPKDADPDHPAHKHVKWEVHHCRALFKLNGIIIQVVGKARVGKGAYSQHGAEVIARACYVKLQDGASKEEVLEFRKQCYDRLGQAAEKCAAMASKNGSSRAVGNKSKAEPGDDSPSKKARQTAAEVAPAPAEQPPAEQPPAGQPPAEQPPAEQPPPEQPPAEKPPAELPTEPAAELPVPKKTQVAEDSSSSASSSVSSDSDAENVQEEEKAVSGDQLRERSRSRSRSPEKESATNASAESAVPKDADPIAAPTELLRVPCGFVDESAPPGKLGRFAAKLSVRSGLRCYQCYEISCRCPQACAA
eukprot:TRINITY_DN6876_c0_g1_i1.p1 TRINITY_DN6876_c0_g1~~TRINITY_DN6876_c0_g1_i1.p1  ORF type:complete len:905 (+),score=256.46 TRINITY_DN6876_c0_g1_i1:121-2835(+)